MSDVADPITNSPVDAGHENEAGAGEVQLGELQQWRNKVALALAAANQAKASVETELLEIHNLKSMIGADLDLDTLRVFAENERAAQDKLGEFASLKAGLARINAGFAALGLKKG